MPEERKNPADVEFSAKEEPKWVRRIANLKQDILSQLDQTREQLKGSPPYSERLQRAAEAQLKSFNIAKNNETMLNTSGMIIRHAQYVELINSQKFSEAYASLR